MYALCVPWLTAEETAARYRIGVKGLLNQRLEGRLPGSLGKRVGKRILWASEDLDAFDGREEPENFGALHALVLEARGINKRLDAIHKELVSQRLTVEETEDE